MRSVSTFHCRGRAPAPPTPRTLATLALLTALAGAGASCGTREDNTVGARLIEDQATRKAVREVVLSPPDSSADYQLVRPSGNAGSATTLLLGARPGYVSRVLLRFDLSSFADSSDVVDSAIVRARLVDTAGDPATLTLTTHRLGGEWAETVTIQDAPAVLAAVDTVPLYVPTVEDSARIPLTELARFWIDTPDSNFGCTLLAGDGADVFQEYASEESGFDPELIVYWRNGDAADSTRFTPTADTFLLEITPDFTPLTPIPNDPGRLTIARGIPARAFLAFTIPDLGERATVNRAQLTLFLDQSLSRLNSFALGISRILESEWEADATYVEGSIYDPQTVDSTTDSVTFEIVYVVDDMRQEGNHGLQVRAVSELLDVDYVRFHSEDSADPARRPVLRIWYTPGDQPEEAP